MTYLAEGGINQSIAVGPCAGCKGQIALFAKFFCVVEDGLPWLLARPFHPGCVPLEEVNGRAAGEDVEVRREGEVPDPRNRPEEGPSGVG